MWNYCKIHYKALDHKFYSYIDGKIDNLHDIKAVGKF